MKVLITGAGGFVGKRLARSLAEKGNEVFALLRCEPCAEQRSYLEHSNIRIIIQDLNDQETLRLPQQADALITLAQSSHFREFPEKAQEVFQVNVTANLRLLEWAIKAGVRRLVHASSGGIYGGKAGGTLSETDLLAVDSPLGFYLGSKLCSEVIVQNFNQCFDTCTILRPFFIYGPGQRKDMFIARLINSVCRELPISLQGEAGLQVNPVYVDDAVNAFSGALNLSGSHIINVAGPDIVTLRRIGELIGGYIDKRVIFETRPGDPVDYVGNNSALRDKLKITPISFADGLSKTIDGGQT